MKKTLAKILTSKKVMCALGGTTGGVLGISIGTDNFIQNIRDFGVVREYTYKGKTVFVEEVQPKLSDIIGPTTSLSLFGIFSGYMSSKAFSKILTSPSAFNTIIKKI